MNDGVLIRRYSLAWLALSNLFGLLCAALLLLPQEGALSRLFNYGRLVTAHANGQLYGWCAVPMAGLLIRWYRPPTREDAARIGWVLGVWSLALGLGVASWLSGGAGGKPFMEWSGWTRPFMPVAMFALWTLLADWVEFDDRASGRLPKIGLLGLLICVPIAFYLASAPEVYPSINPDSGGATGTSLLRSTLGFVAIYGLAPVFLGLRKRKERADLTIRIFWAAFGLNSLIAAWVTDRNVSHREFSQALALGSVLIWIPLGRALYRSYEWPEAAKPWLLAALAWWALLLSTGMLIFLPGELERFKFTQVLVAHAHLAMAGVAGALNSAVLQVLDRTTPRRTLYFWCWQAALALHLASLVGAGLLESDGSGALYLQHEGMRALWLLRFASGFVMTAVSLGWLTDAFSRRQQVAGAAADACRIPAG